MSKQSNKLCFEFTNPLFGNKSRLENTVRKRLGAAFVDYLRNPILVNSKVLIYGIRLYLI